MVKDKNSKENGKDLIWFYKVRVEDLRYMKRQQWIATYYGLLIIAVMIAGFGELKTVIDKEIARMVVFWIGFCFGFSCIFYLKNTQNDMVRYRKGLTEIEKHFKGDLLSVVTLGKETKGYKSFWYDYRIFIPLNLSLIVGVSFLTLILYESDAIYYIFRIWLLPFALYLDKLYEALKAGYKSLEKLSRGPRKKPLAD